MPQNTLPQSQFIFIDILVCCTPQTEWRWIKFTEFKDLEILTLPQTRTMKQKQFSRMVKTFFFWQMRNYKCLTFYLQDSWPVFRKIKQDRRLRCKRGVAWLICVGNRVSDTYKMGWKKQPIKYKILVRLTSCIYFNPLHFCPIQFTFCHIP